MTDPNPPGCYCAKPGPQPWPDTALLLWNDDRLSDQGMAHLMEGKAAESWVSPDVVARFSGVPGATARIEKRGHSRDHWVIRRPAAA
jgi:hypothetical protein